MKSTRRGILRAALLMGLMCVSVEASTGPRVTRMSPMQVVEKAKRLLSEIAALGKDVDIDRFKDPTTLQIACKCTPPVDPNTKHGPVIPVPPPVPPLDNRDVLNGLIVMAALNRTNVPELKFESIAVTITSQP